MENAAPRRSALAHIVSLKKKKKKNDREMPNAYFTGNED